MPNCPRPEYDSDSIVEEPEAPECEHKHGVIICADCLLPFPSPRDGHEMFEGGVIS